MTGNCRTSRASAGRASRAEPGRHHRQGPAPRGLPAQAHGQPGTQVRHPVPGPRASRSAGRAGRSTARPPAPPVRPADRGRPDPPPAQDAAHPLVVRSCAPRRSPTPTPPRRRGRAWASPRGDLPWRTIDGQDLSDDQPAPRSPPRARSAPPIRARGAGRAPTVRTAARRRPARLMSTAEAEPSASTVGRHRRLRQLRAGRARVTTVDTWDIAAVATAGDNTFEVPG